MLSIVLSDLFLIFSSTKGLNLTLNFAPPAENKSEIHGKVDKFVQTVFSRVQHFAKMVVVRPSSDSETLYSNRFEHLILLRHVA